MFLWQPSDGHQDGPPNYWANFTAWPHALTHVSVDIYHFLPAGHAPVPCGPQGAFNCSAACLPTPTTPQWTAEVKGLDCAGAVQRFYEKQMYPRMAPHQRVVLAPLVAPVSLPAISTAMTALRRQTRWPMRTGRRRTVAWMRSSLGITTARRRRAQSRATWEWNRCRRPRRRGRRLGGKLSPPGIWYRSLVRFAVSDRAGNCGCGGI